MQVLSAWAASARGGGRKGRYCSNALALSKRYFASERGIEDILSTDSAAGPKPCLRRFAICDVAKLWMSDKIQKPIFESW